MNPLIVALLATTVSLPANGPTLTHVGQRFLIPFTVSGWNDPTRRGAEFLETNIIASQGLTIDFLLVIGPWTIAGNPAAYYGIHGYYVDRFEQVASFINTPAPCIRDTGGVALSIWVTVNQYWNGGHETLQFGKSVKNTGVEPRLLDCANVPVPIAYGNKTCVFAPAVLDVAASGPLPQPEWYDVAGRRLAAKPTRSGVYFRGVPGQPKARVVVIQ